MSSLMLYVTFGTRVFVFWQQVLLQLSNIHWMIWFVEYKSLKSIFFRRGQNILGATLGLNYQKWLIPCFCWLVVYLSLVWRDLQLIVDHPNLQSSQFHYFLPSVARLVWSMVLLDFWKCTCAHSKSIMCQSTSTTLMEYRHQVQFCTPFKFRVMERKIVWNI